eukprot:gnl/MRDRNA2_/MRDRNA2_62092_c0_seq1.p2 gnl/MRDRNA2_/MRDRNA2_62092_c0~~gnl/MRDRNA2_/MRDRNA2_62092_c0_seq1.p2  ORF type:complete len:126 (-),score=26.28 gnl/MRDRNA2_/MRDRNA2_62092_c0_seq1:70-447(-)
MLLKSASCPEELRQTLVFVSWDHEFCCDPETGSRWSGSFEFIRYPGEVPWLAMPGNTALREDLEKTFNLEKKKEIPILVALNADGTQNFKDGSVNLVSLVAKHKKDAFPMTPDHIKSLDKLSKDA